MYVMRLPAEFVVVTVVVKPSLNAARLTLFRRPSRIVVTHPLVSLVTTTVLSDMADTQPCIRLKRKRILKFIACGYFK